MGWPDFLARAYELDADKRNVIKAGDVVTITLGARSERYVITRVHDDGLCDLGKEQT